MDHPVAPLLGEGREGSADELVDAAAVWGDLLVRDVVEVRLDVPVQRGHFGGGEGGGGGGGIPLLASRVQVKLPQEVLGAWLPDGKI